MVNSVCGSTIEEPEELKDDSETMGDKENEPVLNDHDSILEKDKEQYLLKSVNAIDYEDIDELADDYTEPIHCSTPPFANDCNNVKEKDAGEKLKESSKEVIREEPVKPLAAILPSKYKNVSVTDLFPDFREDKVVRFSKVFQDLDANNSLNIWRNCKRIQKKKGSGKIKPNLDSLTPVESRKSKDKWQMNYGKIDRNECRSDDENKYLSPHVNDNMEDRNSKSEENGDNEPKAADWRFGPAQLWYDMLHVPENAQNFNYGLKIAPKDKIEEEEKIVDNDISGDAFLMVTQRQWEHDVIWNGEDVKQKTIQNLNSQNNAGGWVPTNDLRSAQTFNVPGKGSVPNGSNMKIPNNMQHQKKNNADTTQSNSLKRVNGYETWSSIFPVENDELLYGLWENDIIWDIENMKEIPKPKILTLDPNDDNIILGIPEDIDPTVAHQENMPQAKVKIAHPHFKKSKLLLGKVGVINVLEADEAPLPDKEKSDCDPFNISNDVYYMPRSSETLLKLKAPGGSLIQHSIPVLELRSPFIPTHMGVARLRNFHRPILKRYSHGLIAYSGSHSVLSLQKYIQKKAKTREQERAAAGGGDIFFMRSAEDLTGRDGDLILVEFSEEHPPLINQVGMCTKVKNYFKRKAEKDCDPLPYKYGEIAYAHTSPFLGTLSPGQSIQVIENNMYRAPIYEHHVPQTDFLIIRTRNQYFIREVDGLFVAGQQCPLYEVPGPNTKKANNFVRDFLQVFIYRLFSESLDIPRRIKMDDIKKAFPLHSESSIRKRLKFCADFKRTGMDSNWWVMRPDFRLPNEEEIRAMVTPEQCCGYFSMIAAEQRLKDAGYGEKFLCTLLDDDDDETQLKIDDEIKVAPWNTTRAYIQAMKGKCLLQLSGPGDPTGCGEGFSYIRVPNKPTVNKEEVEAQPKRIVTGTDADLRRLSLSNAKALLRQYGVSEEHIKKLSRWEVIDVVRTLSTEKAKAGEQGMNKFSRGNRFSVAEHQERYREEGQRIFELQNRVLASEEMLSTDENESTDEDNSDIEEMGKNIENMLENKKTSEQLTHEKEEQQRQELRKMLMNESQQAQEKKTKEKRNDEQGSTEVMGKRILKIHRTFKNAQGQEYTRTEIVRKPGIIDAYLSIRKTKDESFIRQFAALDEAMKEEMRREKRRIQEQLRRIKRIQEREAVMGKRRTKFTMEETVNEATSSSLTSSLCNIQNSSNPSDPFPCTSPSKRKKSKLKPDLKLKCGACGQVGHMRTNKACPEYQFNGGGNSNSGWGLDDEQEEDTDRQFNAHDQHLVNVEGTKVTLSSKLIKHAEEMKRQSLTLKLPKDTMNNASLKKRKRLTSDDGCDYVKRKVANRRRTDPVVVMSSLLEGVLNELRNLPGVQMFLFPVNAKLVPDYYKIISQPMDLQTMRVNLRQNKYKTREEFMTDVNQIVANSILYNGTLSPLTLTAQKLLDTCVQCLAKQEDRFMKLEKAINPFLDDNDQVALTYVLNGVLNNHVKSLKEAWPFMKPVDKKLFKDYYTIVKKPMDLEKIGIKLGAHKYHSRKEFLADLQQILQNCIIYNGKESNFTKKAEYLVKVAMETLENHDAQLSQLENSISLVERRAMEQADLDTLWMTAEDENYTIAEPEPESELQETPLSLSEYMFKKKAMEELDFVDVEGDIKPELGKPTISKKKESLEEDLQFSSDNDCNAAPFGMEEPMDTEMSPLNIGNMDVIDHISVDQNTIGNQEVTGLLDTQEDVTHGDNVEENMKVETMDTSDSFISVPEGNAMSVAAEDFNFTESCIHDDLAISESDEELDTKQNSQSDLQPGTQNDMKHNVENSEVQDHSDDLNFKPLDENAMSWWL